MMDSTFGGLTVGTSVTETKQTILAEELALLADKKIELKDANNKYLEAHPEFGGLMDDFVSAIFKSRPDDIIKFGESFFGELYEIKNPKLPPVVALKKPADIALPLVIAGPSGVGKGTILARLMENYPNEFGFSVSHTTRAPRPGETHGVQYYFVEDEVMQGHIQKGDFFIEHAFVHTNYYGTSFEGVERIRDAGKICVLDVDTQGVQSIKNANFLCKFLFIAPPSIEALEERLRKRSTEPEEKLQIRLDNARGEIAYGMEEGNFDAIVVNDDLDATYEQIVGILKEWYPRRKFATEDHDGFSDDGNIEEDEDNNMNENLNNDNDNYSKDDDDNDSFAGNGSVGSGNMN